MTDTPAPAPVFDANGWCHDMSAAPRDGTPILCFAHSDPDIYLVVEWDESLVKTGYPWSTGDQSWNADLFSHWQPLRPPAPPVGEK